MICIISLHEVAGGISGQAQYHSFFVISAKMIKRNQLLYTNNGLQAEDLDHLNLRTIWIVSRLLQQTPGAH